jgi:hypothetical protein
MPNKKTEYVIVILKKINQNVSYRMNKHKFDIRNCNVNPVSHVAIHFGSPENKCSLSDFSFLPTEIIDNNMDRLCKEIL